MSVSMVFLALALRAIPIGTAYAIWTGIGAVGVADANFKTLTTHVGPLC